MTPAAVRRMTPREYAAWSCAERATWATEIAGSGMTDPAAAPSLAAAEWSKLLPSGLDTPGTHLLRVLDDDGAAIGTLWLGPHPDRPGAGWVYDLAVDEDRRDEGFGRRAMLAAEAIGREEGWTEIGLQVFGRNAAARHLYDSLGYAVVRTSMSKSLG